ncbi:MAG: SpoIIIAH-like family protein [Clostridia bacterium]|nr:SpoIIIAH-like family protein [Clostridia bacterium]
MHVLLGKKQIVLAALVVALGLAVFVNWYYTDSGAELFPEGSVSDEDKTPADSSNGEAEYVGNTEESEYFASVRLTRDSAHASALEELQAVIANAPEEGEAAQNTASAIEQLSNVIKMETDIESLVTGKTGNECVAVISEKTVEVLVPTSALSDSNVLTISDVINEVCGNKFENIKISGAAV